MRPYEMWNIHTYRNFADHKNKNKVSTQPASARRKVRLPPSQVPRDESMRFDDELCAVAELIRCPSLPRAKTSDPAHPEQGVSRHGRPLIYQVGWHIGREWEIFAERYYLVRHSVCL